MLTERLFLSFRHVMYSLRGGFLIRPFVIALTLGAAGGVLSSLEEAGADAQRLGADDPVPVAAGSRRSPR